MNPLEKASERREGREASQLEIAAKMKELGDSVEHIIAVTGLSKEEIENS